MRTRDVAALFLLAAIWGAAYLCIRVAAPVLGPLVLMDLRVVLAAAALVVWSAFRRQTLRLAPYRRQLLVLGTLQAALPFALIASAELHITASLAAILTATAPFFAMFARSFADRRLPELRAMVGSLVGLAGVAVLAGWGMVELDAPTLLAGGAALGAALCYGVAAVYASRSAQGISALELTLGQCAVAGVLLLPGALITARPVAPSAEVIIAVLALALVATSAGFILYFDLIRRVGAIGAASVTLLVPVFGVVWGTLILGESVSAGVFLGAALVLTGVRLVLQTPTRTSPGPRPARMRAP